MTTFNANTIPLTASEHQIQLRRAVIASTVGTAPGMRTAARTS